MCPTTEYYQVLGSPQQPCKLLFKSPRAYHGFQLVSYVCVEHACLNVAASLDLDEQPILAGFEEPRKEKTVLAVASGLRGSLIQGDLDSRAFRRSTAFWLCGLSASDRL